MPSQSIRPDSPVALRETAVKRNARYAGAVGPLGQDMLRALKKHGHPGFTGTTWADLRAWLADGITVGVTCRKNPGGRAVRHRIRFDADGSVTLLHHQGGHSAAGEMMLRALGGHTPECVTVHDVLVAGEAYQVGTQSRLNNLGVRVLTLHAAVAWAQREAPDWNMVAPLLRYGVTPAVLDDWLAGGWTLERAKHFFINGATRQVADAWRTAGQANQRTARLAARGIGPDDDARWLAAGFTPGQAQRWRTNLTSAIDPVLAKRLDLAGWTPSGWTRLSHALTHPQSTAVIGGLDQETAIQWTEAGVDPVFVDNWYLETRGDLEAARRWSAAGVHPRVYTWLHNPVQHAWQPGSLTRVSIPAPEGYVMPEPDMVRNWLAVGCSQGDELLSAIMTERLTGITPGIFSDIAEQLGLTGTQGRWFTNDLLRVLAHLGLVGYFPEAS